MKTHWPIQPSLLLLWSTVVNALMRDPTKFLTVYNLCAAKLAQPFRFDPRLAKDLEHLESNR